MCLLVKVVCMLCARVCRLPRIWRPFLHKRVLYSEILDKHFVIMVTLRTMDQIDEHYGLDNYILKVGNGTTFVMVVSVYPQAALLNQM